MSHTSVIDFRSLQTRFRDPLVFSILESLEPGGSVTVVHDQNLSELKKQLDSIGFEGLVIVAQQSGPPLWTLTLTREQAQEQSEHAGCGVCGGKHSHVE